jgi:hypothetical protein
MNVQTYFCKYCEEFLHILNFSIDDSKKTRHRSQCKNCYNSIQKKKYQEPEAKAKKKEYQSRPEVIERRKLIANTDDNKYIRKFRTKLKYQCSCGSILRITEKSRHSRTKKHIKALEDSKKDICSICLEFLDLKCIEITNCHHIFHAKCIYPWIQKCIWCPNCRENIDDFLCIKNPYEIIINF